MAIKNKIDFMNKPKISIVIATFNSQRTLEKVLKGIRSQTMSKKDYEVLVVDGGSKDKTLGIAKKYECRIIRNPMTDALNAKYIGFKESKGRYVIGLDHDEVIKNKKSLETRLKIFKSDERVKAIHSSGYITPKNSNQINQYINEFGDPFSFFIYRLTKDYRFFINVLKNRYAVVFEDDNYILLKVDPDKRAPLMELFAGGGMVDRTYVLKNFKRLSKIKEVFLPHLHLHMLSINPFIAVMKKDPLYHYSAENLQKYLKKLEWRVKNNIYFEETSGSAGFKKREIIERKGMSKAKYAFIPYSVTLILPLVDAVWLSISRRNLFYLIHLPLCIITSLYIIYHLARRKLGHTPMLTSYDGSTKISKKWS
jgi:glycosyltransferase involved in cell wall biosynthesis